MCPFQFATNPPNTAQPPLNHHHHHNPSQLITTHSIPITKSTKNKGKSNQKSIQTQNQTFNGKLNNLEPKIKISTKNPSTQTQIEAAVVTTAMESLLLLCSWKACCCHERGEEQVPESYGKGKDQKKKKK